MKRLIHAVDGGVHEQVAHGRLGLEACSAAEGKRGPATHHKLESPPQCSSAFDADGWGCFHVELDRRHQFFDHHGEVNLCQHGRGDGACGHGKEKVLHFPARQLTDLLSRLIGSVCLILVEHQKADLVHRADDVVAAENEELGSCCRGSTAQPIFFRFARHRHSLVWMG